MCQTACAAYKILIVEDDGVICDYLRQHLNRWGYQTAVVGDFSNVLAEFAAVQPQLVLMDISLPFYNGYHWCQEIRRVSRVPVVFLSSASDNMNIVMAMNMGADDFISKPFDPEVLLAKLAAVLRRAYSYSPAARLLEHRGAVLNLSDASLTYRGQRRELTKNEFRILGLLFERKGQVVAREEIMKRLWDSACFVDDNTLTVNMTRLRHTLAELGLPDLIRTQKGQGYLLED